MQDITDQLKQEKQKLETELFDMAKKQNRLSLISELLRSYGEVSEQAELLPKNSIASILPSSSPFAGKKLVKAIMQLLSAHTHEFLSPREISELLKQGGFVPASENFVTVVNTTCYRKCSGEDASLESGEKDGLKAYRIKP